MKVEIEIDPACIPAGYEVVAYRHPRNGESFTGGCVLSVASFDFESDRHLILRKLYTPPPFFGPGWYAMDMNGRWFSYETEPQKRKGCWIGDGSTQLISNCIIWEKPPSDWTQSKFQVKGDATC